MNVRKLMAQDNDAGFSFIEILIAVLILAIVVISLTAMLTGGLAWVFEAGQKSTDMYLSQEAMENRIRSGAAAGASGSLNIIIDGQAINVPGENVVITRGKANINAFLPR